MGLYRKRWKDPATGKKRVGKVWWLTYTPPGGRPVQKSTGERDKATAEAVWIKVKSSLLAGTYVPEEWRSVLASPPFEVALASYLESRDARKRGPARYLVRAPRKRRSDPRQRPAPAWGEVYRGRALDSLDSEEIEATLRSWARERGWDPKTRNRCFAALSAFLSYAVARRWLREHPMARGRVEKLPEGGPRTRSLRLDEIERLRAGAVALAADEAKVKDERTRAWLRDVFPPLIDLACMTGLRLGEVAGLRRASVREDGDLAWLAVEKTKNGERFDYPLEGDALAIVRERLDRAAPFPASFLFPGPRGKNAYTTLRRAMRPVVEAAGLVYGRKDPEGVTFHTFRHTMATLALNAGEPEHVVQKMGNWKTRAMVAVYARLADRTLRAGAGKVASLVGRGRYAASSPRVTMCDTAPAGAANVSEKG